MTIEMDEFPDGRLMVKRRHFKNARNLRFWRDAITICSRNDEVRIEMKAITAATIYNEMMKHPELKKAVNDDFKRFLGKTLETLLD